MIKDGVVVALAVSGRRALESPHLTCVLSPHYPEQGTHLQWDRAIHLKAQDWVEGEDVQDYPSVCWTIPSH